MTSDPFLQALETSRTIGEHRLEGCGYVGEHPLTRALDHLGGGLDRMVAAQAEAYPAHWSDADRREMAELHLFGSQS